MSTPGNQLPLVTESLPEKDSFWQLNEDEKKKLIASRVYLHLNELVFSQKHEPALLRLREIALDVWINQIFPYLTGPDILNLAVSRAVPRITEVVCARGKNLPFHTQIWQQKINYEFSPNHVYSTENYLSESRFRYGNPIHDPVYRRLIGLCAIGDVGSIDVLMEQHPDSTLITNEPEHGPSPFQLACQNGHAPLVETFLTRPEIMNFYAQNKESLSVILDWALAGRHLEVSALLIDVFRRYPADLNRMTFGISAIRTAISARFYEGLLLVLDFLQEVKIDPFACGGNSILAAVFEVEPHPEIMELLRQRGAITSRAAQYALYALLSGPHPEDPKTLEALQASGANLVAFPQPFQTISPLDIAYENQKFVYAQMIQDAGASVDDALRSAIQRTSWRANTLSAVKSIVGLGVDLNTPYQALEGPELPLVGAIRHHDCGQTDLYEYLVEQGASEDTVLEQTQLSVLEHALQHGNVSVVRSLLKSDPDRVRQFEGRGISCLHQFLLAGEHKSDAAISMVNVLIEAGSRVNSRIRYSDRAICRYSSLGDSIFHSVARGFQKYLHGSLKIEFIKLLIRRGGDPNVRNVKLQHYLSVANNSEWADGYAWYDGGKRRFSRYHQRYQSFVQAYNACDAQAIQQIQIEDPMAYHEFATDVVAGKLQGCANSDDHSSWFNDNNTPAFEIRDCTIQDMITWIEETYIPQLIGTFHHDKKVKLLNRVAQKIKETFQRRLNKTIDQELFFKVLDCGYPNLLTCIQLTRTTGEIARGWEEFLKTFTTYVPADTSLVEEDMPPPNMRC